MIRIIVIALACALCAGAVLGGTMEVKLLGQPCQAKNILSGLVVTDRHDGRERFVIANSNEDTGFEMIYIDFDRDTAEIFRAPAGQGSWGILEVPDDRLVFSTYYAGEWVIFDLKAMKFIKSVKFPGESYIWNSATGSDGRIYGGSYGGGKLGALDLKTYAVEDCGAPAPPNMYLRSVSATADGRLLCNFGEEKPVAKIYDPATKKWTDSPLKGTSALVWNGYCLAGSGAFMGPSLERVTPYPFPAPPAEKGIWNVIKSTPNKDVLYYRQGNAMYSYRKGDSAVKFIAEMDMHGGGLSGGTKDGRLLGIRGQDYYVIKPGDTKLDVKPIPAQGAPRPILFLRADPSGRIWGGPPFGQTLFSMDPKTGEAINTSNICDAGGEVYDVAFYGGKVYAVAYAGGTVSRYAPGRPWNQWENKNPKTWNSIGTRGYIRPIAGIMVGPDKKLYSGWMARYGTYGGAVAITDPISGDTELIENPLGEQAVSGLAVDDKCAYVGTSLGANGLPNKKGESPSFGVIDLATRKVLFSHTFEGAGEVGHIALDAMTRRVTMTAGGKVFVFDIASGKLDENPADVPPINGYDIAGDGKGHLYYGSGKDVIRLDLATLKAEAIARAPENISNVALGPKGDIFLSSGVNVYQLAEKSDE